MTPDSNRAKKKPVAPVVDTGTNVTYLNHLLRGELAAVQTYERALQNVEGAALRQPLRRMLVDHQQNVILLQKEIRLMGGTPAEHPGAWGFVASGVENLAASAGDKPALMALKAGEQHGIRDYQNMIERADMLNSSEVLVNKKLLPDCMRHAAELERMIRRI